MKHLSRYISAGLLTIFLWSCFGVGAGMMGHSVMQSIGEHQVSPSAHAHECCSVKEADAGGAEEQTALFDHHRMDPITLTKMMTVLFVVVSSWFVALSLNVLVSFSAAQLVQYERRWRQEISFFALHIQRLFRAGILHPKSW